MTRERLNQLYVWLIIAAGATVALFSARHLRLGVIDIRFLLLALTAVPHWPAAYCWIVVGPLNVILLVLVLTHEREPKFHAQLA